MGEFKTFQLIMNRMGHVADKRHFIEIRQEGRQSGTSGKFFGGLSDLDLQKQNAYTYSKVTDLEDHLRNLAESGKPLSMPTGGKFNKKEDGFIQPYQLLHIVDNMKGITKKNWTKSQQWCLNILSRVSLDRKNIDSV